MGMGALSGCVAVVLWTGTCGNVLVVAQVVTKHDVRRQTRSAKVVRWSWLKFWERIWEDFLWTFWMLRTNWEYVRGIRGFLIVKIHGFWWIVFIRLADTACYGMQIMCEGWSMWEVHLCNAMPKYWVRNFICWLLRKVTRWTIGNVTRMFDKICLHPRAFISYVHTTMVIESWH